MIYNLTIDKVNKNHIKNKFDVWFGFMQSVPIITNVVSSNPTQEIQHYVIKFVSDLQQVGGFLRVLWFPPPIKLGWP
jgi:hypothetical protein